MKHTQGEWKVENNMYIVVNDITEINNKNVVDIVVAQVLDDSNFLPTEDNTVPNANQGKANAQLIASAPDLLEAFKEIAECCGVVNFSSHNQMKEAINNCIELAEQAIAKATEGV